MSDAAQRMFQTIRQALGRDSPLAAETVDQARHAMMAAPTPRPQWADSDEAHFLAKLEAASASCQRVDNVEAVPGAVARMLGEIGVAPSVQLGEDPLLAGLEWPEPLRAVVGLDGAEHASASVTVAVAGVAETGTLVLTSGPANPTSLNFLPDHHFVVLRASDIVDYMETAWERLHARGPLPRTINFITGPSRTGDVEQTIELGAHGPRSLRVLLIDDTGAAG